MSLHDITNYTLEGYTGAVVGAKNRMSEKSFKVTVTFERRSDGGLRAWSDDIPGLVLSHTDVDGVLSDIAPAIEVILSFRLRVPISVAPLENIREALEVNGIVDPIDHFLPSKEYVAYCH